MMVFFDLDGIVRAKIVPRNTTLNSEYYKGLLERLRRDVRRKGLEKWANGFILQHDNAPCHTSLLVRQFLSNKNITVCPHPPYSPDLAPCDFWPFPNVKITMKGKCFESIQDIEAATTAQLKTLTEEDFQNCFRNRQERGDKCVRSDREYFEGINGNMSFTLMHFLFKHLPYFLSHLVLLF
jgi:histone-lysine N-methyltransferase SETMAR